MPNNVRISADSTCDLSSELLTRYDITLVPLYVQLGEASLRDGVNVDEQTIFDYVAKTGNLPKTSAPTVADYLESFKKVQQPGQEVVHVSLGSKFSSSYQNACIAAKELEGVYVVDSCNLSTGHGHVLVQAAIMAEHGLNGAEILEKCNQITPKVRASFVVDRLDYLYKGGRCSGVAALGANLLKLKPCIEVIDGEMKVGKKYRGNFDKVLLNYTQDKLSGRQIRKDRVFVTHTECAPEVVKAVVNKVKDLYHFDELHDTLAGSTITSHCGPNTLGVLYIEE